MTEYAGESFEVFSSAVSTDGATPLTPDNTASVKLHILDATDEVLVDGEDMTWNADQQLWLYQWNTTTLEPGNYRARAAYRGQSGTINFEFLTMRLHKPKFTVT